MPRRLAHFSDPRLDAQIGEIIKKHKELQKDIEQLEKHMRKPIVLPDTMPPSAHEHEVADVIDFPESMPPTEHTHDVEDIVDLPIIDGIPHGAVMAFARNTAPTGWLECDGAAVSRMTYADLFDAIGITFGSGNGSTTFNLPDIRGEFIRGWDHDRGIDNGRTFGSLQADEFKSHTHTYLRTNIVKASFANSTNGVDNTTPQSSVNTGSSGGTETRPRNIALMYCIKY